jgi:hypothetical protein
MNATIRFEIWRHRGMFCVCRATNISDGRWELKLLRDCDTLERAALHAMGCAHQIGASWGIVCCDGQYRDMSCAGIDFAEKCVGFYGLDALPSRWSCDPDESCTS